MKSESFNPGVRVVHPQFGEGVVVAALSDGYCQVFFSTGERLVLASSLRIAYSPEQIALRNVEGTQERLRKLWLHVEAHALPLMENAAALTSATIDLLPHQVVLTHRIATAGPRRFLIADEVGLGKTIETALVLRELASRGELNRALMVVPAGLVNNWHEEINEVFHLDFEIFGAEGDVTDRRSNAFAKHDRLIASIDTLKRRHRIRKLQDAPPWDLVVFDEAHHLSVYRNGRKIRRTENYKLAEALRDHARDMLLLSATPAYIIPIATDKNGKRLPSLEKRYDKVIRKASPRPALLDEGMRTYLLEEQIEPMLVREIKYRNLSLPGGGYSPRLLAWVECL